MKLLQITAMICCGMPQVVHAEESELKLMRNSTLDPSMRIHVATFDTDNGAEYNSGNCWIAADLFQNQEGVKVRYWCEPSTEEDDQ